MSKTVTGRRRVVADQKSGDCYVIIAGSWVPAGTGVTAPTRVRGSGFTVTQSADGVFNIAFKNPYKERVSIVACAHVAGETTDIYCQTGDVTAATRAVGEVVRVRTMTGGTPTNISGDSDARVSFVAVYSKR
jgi:hypothetical protein